MAYYKKMVGEKCYLSPISMEDAEKWAEWLNDLEVAIPVGDVAYIPISCEKQKEWIDQDIKSGQHIFNIVDLKADQLIGKCVLFQINMVDRNAVLGIIIGEKTLWSKGYGYDATKLLLDYGFNLLNLNNIMLTTYSFNKRAIQCYKKVGFREFGRRRQARIIGNNKYDLVYMDILAEEFESVYVKRFL